MLGPNTKTGVDTISAGRWGILGKEALARAMIYPQGTNRIHESPNGYPTAQKPGRNHDRALH